MQVILGIIVFGLIAIAIIVILVINFMYRNVKRLREDAEDFLYRRGKRNEQKERNPFGEDYFKSSRKPGQQQQGSRRTGGYYSSADGSTEQKTARRTTTSGGVTIIDERQEDKKIFDKGDDEYVEFEEVNSYLCTSVPICSPSITFNPRASTSLYVMSSNLVAVGSFSGSAV